MPKDVLMVKLPDRGLWDLTKDSTGDVASTDTEIHAVLAQLLDFAPSLGRAGWLWDEQGNHGSLLYLITEDTAANRSAFVAYVIAALKPLVDETRISGVTAFVQQTAPGRLDGVVNWLTAAGVQASIATPILFP